MKLKTVKWRRKWLSDKSGSWEEARCGVFRLVASDGIWGVFIYHGSHSHRIYEGKCRSINEGKRKAEAWLNRQIRKVAE